MKAAKLPLFSLGVALLAAPFFFPKRYRVAQRVVVLAEPPEIFPYIDSLKNWPLWTPWSARGQMGFRYQGPESGVGCTQFWKGGCQSGSVRIFQSLRDERVAFRVAVDGRLRSYEGVLSLEPLGRAATRVTWLCAWEGAEIPHGRYLDALMKWRLGHAFLRGLKNLKGLVEESGHGA